MACQDCDRIVQAALPSRPIERGRAGPGLWAHVMVSKYADHCPLYRQSGIFEREGMDLERSSYADWVGRSARLPEPLADAVGRHVRGGRAIFADDTPPSSCRPRANATPRASGPVFGTSGPGLAVTRQRRGIGLRPIAKGSIPPDTSQPPPVGCTRMAVPASTNSNGAARSTRLPDPHPAQVGRCPPIPRPGHGGGSDPPHHKATA